MQDAGCTGEGYRTIPAIGHELGVVKWGERRRIRVGSKRRGERTKILALLMRSVNHVSPTLAGVESSNIVTR